MANKRKRASALGILASDEDSDGVRRRSSKRKNYVEPDSDEEELFENDGSTEHNEGNGKTLTNGELADTAAEDSDGEEGAASDGKRVDQFTISLKIGHDAAQQLERSGSVNGHQHAEHDDDSGQVTTRQRTSRKSVRVNGQTEEQQGQEEEFNEFEDNVDQEQQVEKGEEEDDEEDEEEEVIRPYPRSLRRSSRRSVEASRKDEGRERPTRSSRRLRRRASSESEEYQVESEDLEAELSDLTGEKPDIRGFIDDSDDDMVKRRPTRRSRRGRGRPKGSTKVLRRKRTREQNQSSDYEDSGQNEEEDLQEELRDLNDSISPPPDRKHQLRARKEVNYQIPPPLAATDDYSVMGATMPPPGSAPQVTSSHNKRGGRNANQGPTRRLFPTTGPFGGSDVVSIFGYSTGGGSGSGSGSNNASGGGTSGTATGAANDKVYNAPVDSDSSDDETGGAKIVEAPGVSSKPKKTGLADSDPLGVDMNIDFNSVGGLDTYINQLKEMVSLPLRYPEIYKQFNVTPPRGVLFHGPPGTGKTLMARALAASCSSDGKKITFFMRKGADCLSKWVGEAERQLRLLFEEARNQQPSIIFFDEIDGLAPVRSSKQEQIHASIVSTLLALMDGMDNRGQVIVIGATNRPDSVDPALRRPGRFDREFYFPLPDIDARKKIIGIHTKKWDPPLKPEFIEKIASLTKGYGGADLRALCTEAALNAIQRRYPQIYMSDKKLLVDPQSIHVTAADFMKSVEKIVPSSARSTSSGAEPLPGRIEPLLKHSFDNVKEKLDHLFPKKKKLSALEEAMYEQVDDDGFEKQEAVKGFKMARIFRPRLMVYGEPGMGQHYIGSAVLHYLEGFHVQTFDIGNLLSDSARTPETAVVQMLAEVKRHTPSVIFLPNVEVFFETMSDYAKSALLSFLRNLGSSEEIMLLGIVESEYSEIDPQIKMLFGYSGENSQQLHKPSSSALSEFFKQILDYLKAKPTDYPDYENRPKRKLEALEIAPPPKEHVPTKSELRERELNDKKLKNTLKVKLGPLMDIFKNRYKRFKKPPIDDGLLIHLFEPPVEGVQHEYVKSDDDMILEVASGKKYFNIDLDIIEERLWNGFYSEPKQFLHDIEMIHLDAQTSGDRDRGVKASEMYANAQVAIDEIGDAQFLAQCHDLRKRELVKLKELQQERQQKLQKEIEQQQQQQQQADQVQHENRELNDAPEQAGNHENHEQQQQLQMQAQVEPLNLEALEENGNAPEFSPIKDVQAEEVPKVAVDVPADTQESTTENISLPNGSATNGGTDISIADKDGDSVMNEVQPPPTSDPNEDEHSSEKGNSKDEEVFEAPQREKEYFIPPSPSPGPEPENPDKEIILDTNKMDSFYTRLVDSTKGLTIEQLEQVNSALIDTLWSQRHLWDRNKIIDDLENTLTQVVDSIHAANKKASMEAAHVTGMY